MQLNRVKIALLCALSMVGCAHATDRLTSICTITREQKIGAVVRIEAEYHSTLGHGGSFYDRNCPRVVLVDLTPNNSQEQSVMKFYDALPTEFDPAPLQYDFFVDVTVRVISTRDVPTALGWSRPPLGAEILKVWSYAPLQ